jgi:hypothetical protein
MYLQESTSGSLVRNPSGMSFLQADCFRTKEGERKAFQNIPRTVKVFGLAKIIGDTDTVAMVHSSSPKLFLRLVQYV